MEIWKAIVIALAIMVVSPILFTVFNLCKAREEKKLTFNEATIRTRPTKALSGFFLGFALLVLVGGIIGIIYCCIADAENTTPLSVAIISLCVAMFSLLGFFGYAWVRYNYVVADSEGIQSFRLFRKTRYYRYEEIDSFCDTVSMGARGSLIGYDKNNNMIFAIEAMHIGAAAVAQRLREHDVAEKFLHQIGF